MAALARALFFFFLRVILYHCVVNVSFGWRSVKDDSKANSYLLEYNQFALLLILLFFMFFSLRAMSVFHPILSDLNLLLCKLSYLVKNPFTARPGGEHISSLKNLIWSSSDLLTSGGNHLTLLSPGFHVAVSQFHRSVLRSVQWTLPCLPCETRRHNHASAAFGIAFPLYLGLLLNSVFYHQAIYHISPCLFVSFPNKMQARQTGFCHFCSFFLFPAPRMVPAHGGCSAKLCWVYRLRGSNK